MIIAAFPFSFVMVLMTISLIKELQQVKREIELSGATKDKLMSRRLQKQLIKQELKEEKRWIESKMEEEKKRLKKKKKEKMEELNNKKEE